MEYGLPENITLTKLKRALTEEELRVIGGKYQKVVSNGGYLPEKAFTWLDRYVGGESFKAISESTGETQQKVTSFVKRAALKRVMNR